MAVIQDTRDRSRASPAAEEVQLHTQSTSVFCNRSWAQARIPESTSRQKQRQSSSSSSLWEIASFNLHSAQSQLCALEAGHGSSIDLSVLL